eukprot:c34801_g1_i1 orf=208-1107(+)
MPEEEKKDDNKVIFKVDMHCEACKEKVRKSLRGVPGLENIYIDMKEQKVTVRGNVDADKILERMKKKCGKRTQLLFCQLNREEDTKTEEKIEQKKSEEPPEVTVELKVKMHCGGCAREVERTLKKMEGVSDVKADMRSEKVSVKGRNLDPKKLCDKLKKTGKYAEIVPPKQEEKIEEKKEENKEEKTEEKPPEGDKEEKKADENQEEKKEETKEGEQKDEKSEEKPAEAEVKDEKAEKADEQTEGKEGGESNGGEEEKVSDDLTIHQNKSEHIPMRIVHEYVYAPQLFSDENPNACTIM